MANHTDAEIADAAAARCAELILSLVRGGVTITELVLLGAFLEGLADGAAEGSTFDAKGIGAHGTHLERLRPMTRELARTRQLAVSATLGAKVGGA